MPKYKNVDRKYSAIIHGKQSDYEYNGSVEHYKDWLMMHLGTSDQENDMQLYLDELYKIVKRKTLK